MPPFRLRLLRIGQIFRATRASPRSRFRQPRSRRARGTRRREAFPRGIPAVPRHSPTQLFAPSRLQPPRRDPDIALARVHDSASLGASRSSLVQADELAGPPSFRCCERSQSQGVRLDLGSPMTRSRSEARGVGFGPPTPFDVRDNDISRNASNSRQLELHGAAAEDRPMKKERASARSPHVPATTSRARSRSPHPRRSRQRSGPCRGYSTARSRRRGPRSPPGPLPSILLLVTAVRPA